MLHGKISNCAAVPAKSAASENQIRLRLREDDQQTPESLRMRLACQLASQLPCLARSQRSLQQLYVRPDSFC